MPGKIRLSEDQQELVDRLRDWWTAGGEDITVGGLAGTGKTTIAQQLPQVLGVRPGRVRYCAYTGKAAAVLNRRLPGKPASTIHRLIYQTYETHCSHCPRRQDEHARCHGMGAGCGCGTMTERKSQLEGGPELIVVDEASMVSRQIYDDLLKFQIPVVWLGDHGQLPPIASNFNLMEKPQLKLEQIHRQVAGSPILQLSRIARETGRLPFGEFGPGVRKRRRDGTLDIEDGPWPDSMMVLCGRNDTRVALNKAVRQLQERDPRRAEEGDRVICLRNNSERNVFNGTTGTVLQADPYWLRVALDDGGEYEGPIHSEQFNQPKTLGELPRSADLWDFGYCMTVHKAQGSEADRVILLEEPMGTPATYRRWLYTGVTRAKRELEVVA